VTSTGAAWPRPPWSASGRSVRCSPPRCKKQAGPRFCARARPAADNRATDAGSSILTDRLAGRRLEWQARNGVVQRLGARHAIPTPVTDAIVPLLACCGPLTG
jgi:hypothetical protein